MTQEVGEKLPTIDSGDTLLVGIGGSRYQGKVVETNRWKCEMNQGFMESGSISIYLELTAESDTSHDLPGENVVIVATENVPSDWETPTASIYDPATDERLDDLGNVTEIEVVNNSGD